ncbi:MAG: hypothetical protein IJ207_04425 [Treponema sp.]|uniref:hypothetical protein n=1 Tax=Treponema sp. TaxID=166 RepID=UPI0025F4C974|nr:hypothetical protein [Treponema sp.]MBQ9281428.1 hypothetical protein [Treponema sp.]
MFTFFLKKNLCDGWDNFFFLVASNLVTILILTGSFFAFRFAFSVNALVPPLVFIVSLGVLMMFLFAWGANAAKIADFCSPSFGLLLSSLKSVWKIGFLFGAVIAISLLLARFAFSYYLSIYFKDGNLIGLLVSAILGWFLLVAVVALQWFIPLYFLQGNNGFKKCLRKSFIIFYDNVFFSIGVFLYNIVLFVLSCVFFLLVPGLNGILLSSTNALRLRLYKYDWIEKMAESDPSFENDRDKRNEVPWDDLIAEDRESLGPRKLLSFVFPWR